MKKRLNLTIEDDVLTKAKSYADQQRKSVSELVEGYLNSLVKTPARVNIIDYVERLQAPSFHKEADLKELYYTDQAEKYGF